MYFLLSGYELASEDWQLDLFYNTLNKLKNFSFGHAECCLVNTMQALNCGLKNLLFFLEFLINDGVCLLYGGNCSPGHSSKNSLLNREHATLDSQHKNVCTGEISLVNGGASMRQCDLTYKEKKILRCLIEHDRMLFKGLDRQHASLSGDQIDEFDFLSIDPSGWLLSKDPNGSLMIGGLCSPCMNALHHIDHVDRMGRVLRSFDGVFEFEREKEMFYLESNIHLLAHRNHQLDVIRECRVSRLLANMR